MTPIDPEGVLRLLAETRAANPALPATTPHGSHAPSIRLLVRKALQRAGYTRYGATSLLANVEARHAEAWAAAIAATSAQRPPEAPAAPRPIEDDVSLHRAQTSAATSRSRLRQALARIAALEDELEDYRRLGRSAARPAAWTLQPSGMGREHVPYLLTSDFQIGEVIRPEEIDLAHGYDVEVFRRRYRRLIETAIDLALTHQAGWTYPGMVYARGGDTISGAIHEELKETDQVTPIEAVEIAFEEEAAGILKLAEAFGRVEVKSTGGNHDRDTRKPQSKRADAHSYDRLVAYMLRREFKDDARISFQTSESPDVYFSIYKTRVLLTHGDKIGSRGGQGYVGPAATIMRGAQKVLMEQLALGRPVDEVHMGHFHTPLQLGYALANGCLPGYSEFAKMIRARPEAPSQWLVFYNPRFGAVDWKKIWLEEPRPPGVDWLTGGD